MKKTRILSIVLLIAIVLGSITTAAAGKNFPDVNDSAWYAEFVDYAVTHGMVEGYPDGTFKPDKQLKYAEFIAMMVEQQTTDEKLSQVDTGHWGMPYYNMGLKLGYYSERDISARKLNDPIPRRHMALIAAGYLEKNAKMPDPQKVPYSTYSDVTKEDPDEWYIMLCSTMGILEGYTADNTFKPDKTLKRSEATKVAVCCMEEKLANGGAPAEKPAEQPHVPTATEVAPNMKITGKDYTGNVLVTEIDGLIPKERKEILDAVMKSFKITKENGTFYLSYTQPKVPDYIDWLVEIVVYDHATGGEIDGWGNANGFVLHPEKMVEARKAQTVKVALEVKDMTNKSVCIDLKMYDREKKVGNSKYTGYELWHDAVTREKDFLRITTDYLDQHYVERRALPEGIYSW